MEEKVGTESETLLPPPPPPPDKGGMMSDERVVYDNNNSAYPPYHVNITQVTAERVYIYRRVTPPPPQVQDAC